MPMVNAWLYDGASAQRHDVQVFAASDQVHVLQRDGAASLLAPSELRFISERPDALVYGAAGRDGWRLNLPQPVPEDLARLLPTPANYGGWVDRFGLWPALTAGVTLSALVLTFGYFLPQMLAPFVPRSWEQSFGDALVGDFGGEFCAGPGGQEALDALAARIAPGKRDFDVRVVDVPVVNAAALPGGHIVIFNKLLAQAEGPDEVAGVLAHEIAHVEHRHVTQSMIRELGVGLVMASIGGSTGSNMDALLRVRYSQGAEHEADVTAIERLASAGVSPQATAAFFDRMAGEEDQLGNVGTALSYVSSHPVSRERKELFARSHRKDSRYSEALTRDQWDALADICYNDPRRNSD